MNGGKTDWMLSQLQQELKSNKYDVVSILGGSNDIYGTNSIDGAKKNLDAMYKLAKSKGSHVIAVTPPNKDHYPKKTDQKQSLLNSLVSWIKSNQNKDEVIDFKAMTADKKYFSAADDFLHPQGSAHKMLAGSFERSANMV